MRNERGTILPLAALSMSAMIGFMGLALDAGALYNHRRVMQTAADAGALAGASEIYRAQTGMVTGSSRTATAENGFTDGTNGVSVTVNHPPTSGFYIGDARYAEVLIAQPSPTYFMQLFGFSTVSVPARAVAGVGANGRNCIYVLDPAMPDAFRGDSSARLTAGCGMIVNSRSSSAMHTTSSAQISTTGVSVTGNFVRESSSTISPAPTTGVAPEPDPLAYIAAPSVPSTCNYTNFQLVNNQSQVLSPGVYCGGIRLEGDSLATLNPGLYILKGGRIGSSITDGSLHLMSNARIQGTGVTIYITQGGGYPYRPIKMESSTRATLSAPTSGTYSGILFFQDRTVGAIAPDGSPWQHRLQSSSVSSFEGALYFPTQVLRVESSTSTTAAYTLVVARSFVLESTSLFNVAANYSGLTGGSPIKRISLVE